ncbi:MAG TPA: hypothetical protein EYG21_00710 [Nitrospinaceae bacterium]|jgi:hypothetical protein|nr:hypothetical protein [Nitrospinaceae bacterium]
MQIGLVPVSAKPYHIGHHSLVETASSDNDIVFLFVSVSDRNREGEFPISGKDMHRIWREELESIMPSNVNIEYGGSPVRKTYQKIQEAVAEGSEDVFTIYSDVEDSANNYPFDSRDKYMQPLYGAGQVVFAAEEDPQAFTRGQGTPDVSGGKLRHYLESKNFERFADYMPPGVDAQNIFDILSKGGIKETLVRDFVFAVLK